MTQGNGKWGFGREISHAVDLDRGTTALYRALVGSVPSFRACMFCGSCSATCTVAGDGMNFMQVHLHLQRGEAAPAAEMAAPCLLCGKCTLACPRNVDTRSVIYNLKVLLHEYL